MYVRRVSPFPFFPSKGGRPNEPSRLVYLARVLPQGDIESPGEAKVRQLEAAPRVDEQVLGLEVPVEHAVGVAEGHALHHLVHVGLSLLLLSVGGGGGMVVAVSVLGAQ